MREIKLEPVAILGTIDFNNGQWQYGGLSVMTWV